MHKRMAFQIFWRFEVIRRKELENGKNMSMDLNITLSYSGDAEYGIDYESLPTEMVLPAFQEQVIIPINVFFETQ